ncbi:unnamed protein product, partial [Ectocarpus fasciculatus]
EDYIECESCSEWYHFSCEGLDEDNPPDRYSCKRCRQLAAKGQKVPAQERRRNKAKTNEYLSEMLANKVMQIQQWVKEVKVLASTNTATAAAAAAAAPSDAAAAAAAAQARYASLKELLARREELEAPLEEEEEEESNAKGGKGGRGSGGGRGGARGGARGGGGGGGGGSSSGGSDAGDEEDVKVVHGMGGVYAEASALLESVAEESDRAEGAVDEWFDEHPESYYKKSDGGARLGYWKTSVTPLEAEVGQLEQLVASARSARAGPPAAVAAAEDALAAARWVLKAVGLLTGGAGGGTGGAGAAGAAGLPAFSEVSALLDNAGEGMSTSADRRGRANTAWQHVNDIRSMATQWIRRAKTCLRADGAAAGVTLAVMRRHLSSGDAVPVNMPEYHELERVASEWEAWESRALRCAAILEAVPLEDLAGTLTVCSPRPPGEKANADEDASGLLQEAAAFSHGIKSSAKDALTRALGRRGWAQRAAAVISCEAVGIARPSVALTQSLMTEAGKLGLLRAAGGGVSPLVTKVKALAEGEGPATR